MEEEYKAEETVIEEEEYKIQEKAEFYANWITAFIMALFVTFVMGPLFLKLGMFLVGISITYLQALGVVVVLQTVQAVLGYSEEVENVLNL